MAVLLIARFEGDLAALTEAYDRAHALVMSRGGTVQVGELRHHCAIGEDALYIVGGHGPHHDFADSDRDLVSALRALSGASPACEITCCRYSRRAANRAAPRVFGDR